MSDRFDLTCETIHCFGKHVTHLGTVDNEQEAIDWKERQASGKKRSLSPDDPIRTCPVVRCPLKKQTPRFGYQKMSD